MSAKKIAIFFLIAITGITVYFLISMWIDGFRIWGHSGIQFDKTGEVGDFIGGVVGTIINAAAFYFLYLTLNEQRTSTNEQRSSFEKERFESKFFDLLKIHRDNISELKYKKYNDGDWATYEGREVFKIIFQEFWECLTEVRKFSPSKDPDDYLLPQYKIELQKIIKNINPKIDITELALVDISYCIVFFGVDNEGEILLRDRFKKQYQIQYIYRLLKFIRLKPKVNFTPLYNKWAQLNALNYNDLKGITEELYRYRRHVKTSTLSEAASDLIQNVEVEKYYGGHHFRLGHYFRHLFQSYKYLNAQTHLEDSDKYFFGKTYRAQLSSYEQAMLFANSISTLGMKWEYSPDVSLQNKSAEQIAHDTKEARLITKYNLIKNLPGNHFFGLTYKDYYPKVKYEFKRIS